MSKPGDKWTDLGAIPAATGKVGTLCSLGSGIVLQGTWSFGGTFTHILRSTDYARTWIDLGHAFIAPHITVAFYDLGGGHVVGGSELPRFVISASADVVISDDYGATWIEIGALGAQTSLNGFCNLGSGVVLAATGEDGALLNRVYKSTDYGATWPTSTVPCAALQDVWCLVNLGGGIVIAGIGDRFGGADIHIAVSSDSGASWTDLGAVSAGMDYIYCLCNLGNGIVLAGGSNSALATPVILRSDNYGSTWGAVTLPAGILNAFVLVNGENGRVIGEDKWGAVFRSLDYGVTWGLGTALSIGRDMALVGTNRALACAGTNTYETTWSVGTPSAGRGTFFRGQGASLLGGIDCGRGRRVA